MQTSSESSDPKLKVVSPFEPAGDQPAAIKAEMEEQTGRIRTKIPTSAGFYMTRILDAVMHRYKRREKSAVKSILRGQW